MFLKCLGWGSQIRNISAYCVFKTSFDCWYVESFFGKLFGCQNMQCKSYNTIEPIVKGNLILSRWIKGFLIFDFKERWCMGFYLLISVNKRWCMILKKKIFYFYFKFWKLSEQLLFFIFLSYYFCSLFKRRIKGFLHLQFLAVGSFKLFH